MEPGIDALPPFNPEKRRLGVFFIANRTADLIAEGFNASIGGGFELAPGMVSQY